MKSYKSMNNDELQAELKLQNSRYELFRSRNLSYDMTRGKPGADQLDISMDLLNDNLIGNGTDANGNDCRNYGLVEGIPEAKKLFGDIFDVKPEQVIVSGNSSLNIMYDTIVRCLLFGAGPDLKSWGSQGKVKFICPAPGYDRHFAICEQLGIDMITVELNDDGPDMDVVEKLVAEDSSIKGLWSIPKYSNPTGIVYSDNVVDRLANMETAANDFRIFWDDAYSVHFLKSEPAKLKNILKACEEAGNSDRPFVFTSTSKITFPGAGISAMAASKKCIDFFGKLINIQTIGPDKLNQLRHVRYLKDYNGIITHMKKHAAILKPKFDAVLSILQMELTGLEIAVWSNPEGGYFINVDTIEKCATKIVKMSKDCGLLLTPAGATFPYKKDPKDTNIRIAPTFPPLNQLGEAIEIMCICIKLVSLESLLNR